MELKNETYDIGKWLVLIFLPAFAVLIGGLGELYAWTNAAVFVPTINLISIFLGSIMQLSSQVYYKGNNYWGGGPHDPTST